MPAESVNVLVINSMPRVGSRPLSEDCMRQITAVSPKVKLWDVTDLAHAEQNGDFTAKEQFDALLADAEVIYGFSLPQNVLARAPRLKWIQAKLAGVNHILDAEIVASPLIVTNTLGMHGTQASELVFWMMLTFAKQAQLCFQLKQEKQWQPFVPALLSSKTVGILGLGSIGLEVARLAKAFGMRAVVVRVKHTMRSKYADVILPPEQLRELLSQSDFVVIALPLTPETRGLIGEVELRAMKPTAYLINVARGGIVAEEALISALSENWIAGAGLDVFATEPLPPDSKLWALANLIITPHIAGRREDYDALANKQFCENLRRYLSGKQLLHIVDKKKGY